MGKVSFSDTRRILRFLIIIFARMISFIAILCSSLAFLTAAGIYIFDKKYANGLYTGKLIKFLIEIGFLRGAVSRFEMIAFGLTALLCIGIIVFKTKINKSYKLKIKSMRFDKVVLFHFGNAFMNITVLCCLLVLMASFVVIGYIHSVSDNTQDGSYLNNFDYIHSQINDKKTSANLILSKVIMDVQLAPFYLDNLGDDEYKRLGYDLNALMEIKGGPEGMDEHYFRNAFDRAPKTLEEMLDIIQNDNKTFGWKLMPVSGSLFHMNGKDGEYNLKFLSSDGFFEAVYNKQGILLTESNDPVNMGTYNFTDPFTEPAKHSLYDIMPFLKWGNSLLIDFNVRHINDYMMRDQFEKNPDAQERYRQISRLVGNDVKEFDSNVDMKNIQ